MQKKYCELDSESFQDLINIGTGLFNPLKGFLNQKDFSSVVNNMTLDTGEVWTIPITFDIPESLYKNLNGCDQIYMTVNGEETGVIEIEDIYKVDMKDFEKVFKTDSRNHPGLKKEFERSPFRVGGKTVLSNTLKLENYLHPENTKSVFKSRGWKTIVGFQTRNPIHKAHEHLQRIGLEICDGLFINPLTGWKKVGDFAEEAILTAYSLMLKNYYPPEQVYFEVLKTQMRYAGPREAIFHAIIRRNLGCTHFIIGRDHAGVGNFYGHYEAHELARNLQEKYNLGIELLLLNEPYYCKKCNEIVSSKTCRHKNEDIILISGTKIRSMLRNGEEVDERLMRRDVAEAIKALGDKIFIQ